MEHNISQLNDFESSKTLNNTKSLILFCIECMRYFKINIRRIYYVPNSRPVDPAIKDRLGGQLQMINRWYNSSTGLTNSQLYTYFRKVMMRLLPFGVFKVIKDQKTSVQVLHYKNRDSKKTEYSGNVILEAYEKLSSIDRRF